MNKENKEKLLNLLADQSLFGLSEAENTELEKLKREFPEFQNDDSFEFAAAAINISNLEINQPLPAHLQTRILNDAEEFFASSEESQNAVSIKPEQTASAKAAPVNVLFENEPKKLPWWSWLGWGAAALAAIALAVNLWQTSVQPKTEIVKNPETIQTPTPEPSAEQKRRQLLASSAGDIVRASWTEPDSKNAKQISGDIVWSSAEQKGYMRFRGLPANDPNKETYQLWIFDENQSEKYPIDGGVFDVSDKSGEVVVPIDPAIKVKKPTMFAVTKEKPGGVVVSDRRNMVAVAKV